MKRFFTFVLCLAGFLLIAAPTYIKEDARPILTNGKPFAEAHLIHGQWTISVEDFARLGGSNLTLEPNFKLQGNQLIGLLMPAGESTDDKHKGAYGKFEAPTAANKVHDASVGKINQGAIHSSSKGFLNSRFHIQRAGVISNNVIMLNGKAYIPLADVARAFGGTFTAPAGNLKPTDSLSLNFAIGGNGGILAFNQ